MSYETESKRLDTADGAPLRDNSEGQKAECQGASGALEQIRPQVIENSAQEKSDVICWVSRLVSAEGIGTFQPTEFKPAATNQWFQSVSQCFRGHEQADLGKLFPSVVPNLASSFRCCTEE